MKSCRRVLIGLFLFISFYGNGQEIKTVYLEPESLVSTNFEPVIFDKRQQEIKNILVSFFKNDSAHRTIEVIQLYHASAPTSYSISILNAPEDRVIDKLQSKLNELSPIKPIYSDYAIATHYSLNGGNKSRKSVYYPNHTNWKKNRFQQLNSLELSDQFTTIQRYISQEIFPFFLAQAYSNGQHSEAVLNYLKQLEQIDWKIENLATHYTTDYEPYWKALEASKAAPSLLPCLKVLFLFYEGKISYAQNYVSLIYNLHEPHESMRNLIDRVVVVIGIYLSNESAWSKTIQQVKRGGDVEKGIQSCMHVLRFNPNSELALFNLIEINATSKVNPQFDYNTYQEMLVASNPISANLTLIQSKSDSYEQYLREATINYFVDPFSFDQNFYDYAETALALEQYAIAADAIHLIQSNERIKALELLDLPLYYEYACFKHDAIANLKLHSFDRKKIRQFKRIDRKLRQKKKKHPAYADFKD